VRRFWIHHLLPLLFAALPVLAGGLVFAAVPAAARSKYLERIAESPIDWVILALGGSLFLAQTLLTWKALQWADDDFDQRPDKWLTHLAQAAEWFPLLGLIGTVAAILQTFGNITADAAPPPQQIIRDYAPALTATASGLFMALLNILPTWVANLGRDLIRSLAGPPPAEVPLTPVPPTGDRP
jgi:hypothetical protein